MNRWRRASAAGIVVLAAVLAGCATGAPHATTAEPAGARPPLSEVQTLTDPRGHVGASTAVVADDRIEPVSAAPVAQLPATVTSFDADGETSVEVTDVSRVIALDISGSIAATVWGLGFGDALVGRDVSTTFPGTEQLDVVTSGGHTVNVEAVISLAPTLVLTDGSIGPRDVVEQLRTVGIEVVSLHNEPSFDGAAQLARDVAAVFGAHAEGELLAERIRSGVAATTATIAAFAPAGADERVRMMFLYLRGTSGVYYLFGEGSGADELIDALAGVDVAGELGWEGMRPLTDEAMVAADPDLILVMTGGLESVGGVDGLLEAKPAIALTAAGEHRRFVDMADGQILSFGPRAAAVLDALARAVYAP